MSISIDGSRPGRAVTCALVTTCAVLASLAFGGGSAFASGVPAVAWSLRSIAQPTSFAAADDRREVCEIEATSPFSHCDRYSLLLTNIGTRASAGTITITDTLPAGLVTSHAPGSLESEHTGFRWECATAMVVGREVVTCTTEHAVRALRAAEETVNIPVNVEADVPAGGSVVNEATVSGGEAASVGVKASTPIAAPPLAFEPLAFSASSLDAAGALDTQAGAHPGGLAGSFEIPSVNKSEQFGAFPYPVENVKQIVTDLPPGVIGDARSAPTCSLAAVSNLDAEETQCPSSTRVGSLALAERNQVYSELAIFNVTPERGYPAEFAVFLPGLQRAALLYGSLVGNGADAHVRLTSAPQTAFLALTGISLTFFGDPAAIDQSPIMPTAFATNPADCGASGFTTTIYLDSWEHPGRVEADGAPDLSDPNWKRASSTAPPVTGCEKLQFHPTLSVQPTNTAPDSPTGFNFDLTVPQNEDPNGLATPPLKNATITLPRGIVVSPSAANGLQACSDEQAALSTNQPSLCPQASQVATVTVHTPLLEEPLEGQLYLLSPECSPCSNADAQAGRLAHGFIQIHSERYGITLKIPGTISINPSTGQLSGTFDNNPQQPFTSLEVHFPQDERAAASTTNTCGALTTTSELVPWSSPQTPDATPSSSFAVGCASDAFTPSFTGGTTVNQAGAYSPFTLTFSRRDGEQELGDVEQTLPSGLLARLAGVSRCGEAEASAGTCSSASRIGTVTVGAGPGSDPFYTTGGVYLTGPYNGGPFGVVVVVQAVAGPFNLGTVVVRGSIRVDPTTAQATVVSDPFPKMLAGIPLQIRTVNVNLERPGFTFNSTNCAAMAVTGRLISTQGATAAVSSPYEAANCASLPFKPVLTASTAGKASKAGGATLTVKVTSKGGPQLGGGEANIRSVKVDLPLQLPSRLSTLQKACVAKVFEANPALCPKESDVGTATANTPLLAVPLSGPAYLVSHGGEAFPDLEIVLQGEGVTLILVGNTKIKKGITSSTFKAVPDAPVSSFELKLPTGKFSILGANVPASAHYSLCGQSLRMPTVITGQNGGVIKQTTRIGVTRCAKAKKASSKAKRAKRAANTHRRGK